MQVSPQGLKMIAEFEGCVLHPYRDSVGKLTIGVGHLILPGEVFTMLSYDEAMTLFAKDIEPRQTFLNSLFDSGEVNQAQFDACMSLMYNIGNSAFENSTVYSRIDEDNDIPGAADAFLMWQHPSELLPRRQKERNLFLTGQYPT